VILLKVIAIIECDSRHTLQKYELKSGVNNVPSCRCGNYFGDEGGKVTVELDKN